MNPQNELKHTLTAWWEYMAIRAACQLDLFDLINSKVTTFEEIAARIHAKPELIRTLLHALKTTDYLQKGSRGWELTPKGFLLTESHPESMKQAAILWGGEHINAWQGLSETIKTGKPAFEQLFGSAFFDYLADHPPQLVNYHRAMEEYAREDYKKLRQLYDFSAHDALMDVGGGTGALLQTFAKSALETDFVLFDLPEVIKIAGDSNFIQTIGGNFFESIPSVADGIFLARVLHDWDDERALVILRNCHAALPPNGKLYLLENHADRLDDGAALLSLNMAVICKSHERTSTQYRNLLSQAGFQFDSEIQINALQWMIIAKK
ncbi:MAG: methyltransferase [Bacteroidota bacterium]